jgi:hypothetical protein
MLSLETAGRRAEDEYGKHRRIYAAVSCVNEGSRLLGHNTPEDLNIHGWVTVLNPCV